QGMIRAPRCSVGRYMCCQVVQTFKRGRGLRLTGRLATTRRITLLSANCTIWNRSSTKRCAFIRRFISARGLPPVTLSFKGIRYLRDGACCIPSTSPTETRVTGVIPLNLSPNALRRSRHVRRIHFFHLEVGHVTASAWLSLRWRQRLSWQGFSNGTFWNSRVIVCICIWAQPLSHVPRYG